MESLEEGDAEGEWVVLLDLANKIQDVKKKKNTGCLVKLEYQINNE